MGQLVYERERFKVYKCHDGYTIHNGAHEWHDAHCHSIKSLDVAKQIIDNVSKERIPSTKCAYVFDSHIRLAGETEYRETLMGVKERRRNRSQQYYNSNKGIR